MGFHAQQSIEKALKAVLSSSSVAFRRTHDLAELLDLITDHRLPSPPFADFLDELNPFAVEVRYGLIAPGSMTACRPSSGSIKCWTGRRQQASATAPSPLHRPSASNQANPTENPTRVRAVDFMNSGVEALLNKRHAPRQAAEFSPSSTTAPADVSLPSKHRYGQTYEEKASIVSVFG